MDENPYQSPASIDSARDRPFSSVAVLTEPISFTGRLSLQDVLDIHRYRSRLVFRPSIRLCLAALSALIAALTIGSAILLHSVPPAVFVTVMAACLFFPYGGLLIDRLAVRWRYHRDRDKYTDHTAIFKNDSVSTIGPNSELRCSWNQLACVVAAPRGLLFLLPPHRTWFWLPQRLFEGNRHREAILELATEHGVLVRQMS